MESALFLGCPTLAGPFEGSLTWFWNGVQRPDPSRERRERGGTALLPVVSERSL